MIEFGHATGVAASGLLLLRMADPDDRSDALPAFSIKQLMLQPFLAGGVVAVAGWGCRFVPASVLAWCCCLAEPGPLLSPNRYRHYTLPYPQSGSRLGTSATTPLQIDGAAAARAMGNSCSHRSCPQTVWRECKNTRVATTGGFFALP